MSGMARGGGGERGLQIAAMDRPIGRAVALLGVFAERHAHDLAPGHAVKDAQRRRRDGGRPQPALQAEIDQDARGVGRQLDAGTGFLEPLRLFQHDDAKAVARERQRRGQTADTGSGDNDRARGHQRAG